MSLSQGVSEDNRGQCVVSRHKVRRICEHIEDTEHAPPFLSFHALLQLSGGSSMSARDHTLFDGSANWQSSSLQQTCTPDGLRAGGDSLTFTVPDEVKSSVTDTSSRRWKVASAKSAAASLSIARF